MAPQSQSQSNLPSITPQPRKVVGVLAIIVFLAFALTQLALFTLEHTDLPLPASAEEAIQNLQTPRFRNMAQDKKDEYLAKTAFFIDALVGEKRRELFRKYRVDDEHRSAMIRVIAQKEFQKAVAYDKAATSEEKARLVEVQVDKELARFAALPPEMRDPNRLLQRPPIPSPIVGTPPPFGMPGGGWFSRIRNYYLEDPELRTPENMAIAKNFQSAVIQRLAQRQAAEQPPATAPAAN
jgi:hypothetical protein